jgi:hypothetical protein
MSDTNKLGEIGEAAVTLAAVMKGYYVGRMPQDCPYDLVIDRGSGPKRVQVKYRRLLTDVRKNGVTVPGRAGSFQLNIKHSHHSNRREYKSTDFDAFVVYVPDNDTCYWIPSSVCDEGKATLTFRVGTQGSKDRCLDSYVEW